jgi:Flp pilus assembly protein TadG
VKGRRRLARGDEGTALVEFFWLGILLLVPITYAILFAFQVQRASFAVSEATRSAARAYVTTASGDTTTAAARAYAAAKLTMQDHGLPLPPANFATPTCKLQSSPPATATAGCFQPHNVVTVTMTVAVHLPLLPAFDADGGAVTVKASHDEVFDNYADYGPAGG